jgi:hypothetical protein
LNLSAVIKVSGQLRCLRIKLGRVGGRHEKSR